ncbi:hypothetical protein [Burkholderia sp. Ac-20379]|uniref:hypothetical protein n=1 Tax=Burkholderia sp. Ac-20379 TaxID=2703900 RepID=UPI00197E82FE|nr:hypothetical protein [Burkholderia sp. Ac-20379]MBN3728146.1 hypothetical protein [Burkholderia sp. Ac-20379]
MRKPEFSDMASARPELLCYLVAIAAASYALTQEWRVDHVVDCCRRWLDKQQVTMGWLDRVRIGQLALKIASRDLLGAGIAVRLSSVPALFTNEMELNEASTMVQRMMVLCQEAL